MFFEENKTILVIYQSDTMSQRKVTLQDSPKRKVRLSIGTLISRRYRMTFDSSKYSRNAFGTLI